MNLPIGDLLKLNLGRVPTSGPGNFLARLSRADAVQTFLKTFCDFAVSWWKKNVDPPHTRTHTRGHVHIHTLSPTKPTVGCEGMPPTSVLGPEDYTKV